MSLLCHILSEKTQKEPNPFSPPKKIDTKVILIFTNIVTYFFCIIAYFVTQ